MRSIPARRSPDPRAQAARPQHHQLRRHERDGERDPRARRAARDGARRGGGGEMVGLAGALVLNIGTLSERWIDAMLARRQGGERARRAGRARPGRRRRDLVSHARRRSGCWTSSTSRCCAGTPARSRRWSVSRRRCAGVESVGAGGDPAELAREAARTLGLVASVTGAVDHVSDGERSAAVANGHALLAVDHRHRLHVDGDHRLLPRRARTIRSMRPSRRSSPSAWPARTRPPRRRARAASTSRSTTRSRRLDPATLSSRAKVGREAARARGGRGLRAPRGRGRRDGRPAAAEGRADGGRGRARPGAWPISTPS